MSRTAIERSSFGLWLVLCLWSGATGIWGSVCVALAVMVRSDSLFLAGMSLLVSSTMVVVSLRRPLDVETAWSLLLLSIGFQLLRLVVST